MASPDDRLPPLWLVEVAIEPKSKADQEKLGAALAELAAEDPSFWGATDQESGQMILKGMSELHLDSKIDILRRTYKIDANIGAPQVAFRERITRRAEVVYTHKKLTGGTGQFARVSSWSNPTNPARDLSSNPGSPRTLCQSNISPASKRASTAC